MPSVTRPCQARMSSPATHVTYIHMVWIIISWDIYRHQFNTLLSSSSLVCFITSRIVHIFNFIRLIIFMQNIGLCFFSSPFSRLMIVRIILYHVIIPPASTKLKGGYTGITLFVCPSVDRIVSTLYLQEYSSDPLHICTSYEATSGGVMREILANFLNL